MQSHCPSLKKSPKAQTHLSQSFLTPEQHRRFSALYDIKADVKKSLHKAVTEKNPPGQAGAAGKWRCRLLLARTGGPCWRHEADGPGGYQQSGLCPAPRASVGPAKLRTGVLLSSVSKPTLQGEKRGQGCSPWPFQHALRHQSWGQGKAAPTAAPAPLEGGEGTRSAWELVSHPPRKAKRPGSCLQARFALHVI